MLIAIIDFHSDELKIVHVPTPNPAFRAVSLEKIPTRVQEPFTRTEKDGLVTFRVKYWQSSAVAYPRLSFHPSTETKTYAARFSA